MSQEQKPNPDFEQRLLARLKAVVAERGTAAAATEAAEAQVASPSWRRRGPRLALGAATALAAVAVALIVSAGGDNPPAAFAVEPQEGGGVTIKVYSLNDASGLEQALEEAGIQVPGDMAAGRDDLPGTSLHALTSPSSGRRDHRRHDDGRSRSRRDDDRDRQHPAIARTIWGTHAR